MKRGGGGKKRLVPLKRGGGWRKTKWKNWKREWEG